VQLFRKTTLKFPLDKTVGQHHFCWRNPVIFSSLVIMGDDVLDWGHERTSMMKLLTLALGAVLFALSRGTFCECLGASRLGRAPLGECRLQDLAQRY
jgi:hypothetical protein